MHSTNSTNSTCIMYPFIKCNEKINNEDPQPEILRKIIMNNEKDCIETLVHLQLIDFFKANVHNNSFYSIIINKFDDSDNIIEDIISPVMLAIIYENTAIFKLALTLENDWIAHVSSYGNTLLHFAATRSNNMLLLLLESLNNNERKRLIDILNSDKQTPLMFAARYSCVRNVKVLVLEGADVNSVDNYGNTCV